MAIGAFSKFIQETSKNAALKNLKFIARGKKMGQMYRALSKADKAALSKRAAAAKKPKHVKVQASIRVMGRAKGIPVKLIKKVWHSTKGASTAGRLNAIAKKAGLKVRRVKKN